jgi:hypothetical protein
MDTQVDDSNLLVFDPATAAFTPLTGVNFSQNGIFTSDGKLFYFTGWKGDGTATTVWVTDGTTAGSQALVDGKTLAASPIRWLGEFHNVGVFIAGDSQNRISYWRTDGTPAGTSAIAPLSSTQTLSAPVTALTAGNNFYFVLNDNAIGTELYALENEAPVAADDSASTTSPTAVSIDVASNDSDPDGHIDIASIRIVDAPGHGTATATADGHVIYTPAADFSGTDTFTYSIADNQGRVVGAVAHVTVKVAAATPPPTSGGNSNTGDTGGSGKGGGGGGGGGAIDSLLLVALATRLVARRMRRPA